MNLFGKHVGSGKNEVKHDLIWFSLSSFANYFNNILKTLHKSTFYDYENRQLHNFISAHLGCKLGGLLGVLKLAIFTQPLQFLFIFSNAFVNLS